MIQKQLPVDLLHPGPAKLNDITASPDRHQNQILRMFSTLPQGFSLTVMNLKEKLDLAVQVDPVLGDFSGKGNGCASQIAQQYNMKNTNNYIN